MDGNELMTTDDGHKEMNVKNFDIPVIGKDLHFLITISDL